MSDIDKKWYVVRAVSGQEKRVQETVETEIAAAGLQDYVGQVLIPMEKVFTIRNGKKVSKERTCSLDTFTSKPLWWGRFLTSFAMSPTSLDSSARKSVVSPCLFAKTR